INSPPVPATIRDGVCAPAGCCAISPRSAASITDFAATLVKPICMREVRKRRRETAPDKYWWISCCIGSDGNLTTGRVPLRSGRRSPSWYHFLESTLEEGYEVPQRVYRSCALSCNYQRFVCSGCNFWKMVRRVGAKFGRTESSICRSQI